MFFCLFFTAPKMLRAFSCPCPHFSESSLAFSVASWQWLGWLNCVKCRKAKEFSQAGDFRVRAGAHDIQQNNHNHVGAKWPKISITMSICRQYQGPTVTRKKKDILDKYTVVVRMGRFKLPIKPSAAGIEDKVWGCDWAWYWGWELQEEVNPTIIRLYLFDHFYFPLKKQQNKHKKQLNWIERMNEWKLKRKRGRKERNYDKITQ